MIHAKRVRGVKGVLKDSQAPEILFGIKRLTHFEV
jgi:hypothetical protein